MSEIQEKTLLLDKADIQKKLERIAYEIYENNYNEKTIYLVGVKTRGSILAKKISKILKKITEIEIELVSVILNKSKPSSHEIELSIPTKELNRKVVVIVDDVCNTGRTLLYAIRPLLDELPKKLQVAVLVDRQHKTFPIACDYVGYSLSTTLQDHIEVELEGKEENVYLR